MVATSDMLYEKGLIPDLPNYIKNNISYEVITGSQAYGMATDDSDYDIYSFCVPYKDMIFPHLRGEIQGFGRQQQKYEQFQKHHIIDKDTNKEYDFNIYNIVKYFNLCMDNNPNMIDTLFVPQNCILYTDTIGRHIRSNRKLFLHKGSKHKFIGYAHKQVHLIRTKHRIAKEIFEFEEKNNMSHETSINDAEILSFENKSPEYDKYLSNLKKLYENNYKRANMVRQHGFDRKFGSHVIRLLNEGEQILSRHDLDLQENREQLKSVRRGDWSFEKILEYFDMKEKLLDELYIKSTLRMVPDEAAIKNVLIQCLEIKFGNLNNAISKPNNVDQLIITIEEAIRKYR